MEKNENRDFEKTFWGIIIFKKITKFSLKALIILISILIDDICY